MNSLVCKLCFFFFLSLFKIRHKSSSWLLFNSLWNMFHYPCHFINIFRFYNLLGMIIVTLVKLRLHHYYLSLALQCTSSTYQRKGLKSPMFAFQPTPNPLPFIFPCSKLVSIYVYLKLIELPETLTAG